MSHVSPFRILLWGLLGAAGVASVGARPTQNLHVRLNIYSLDANGLRCFFCIRPTAGVFRSTVAGSSFCRYNTYLYVKLCATVACLYVAKTIMKNVLRQSLFIDIVRLFIVSRYCTIQIQLQPSKYFLHCRFWILKYVSKFKNQTLIKVVRKK